MPAYITPELLKVAASIFGITGSLILAFRVSGILNALAIAATVHEVNINQLMDNPQTIVHFTNATKQVASAQRRILLYFGFFLFVTSGALQLASLFV